MPRKYTIIGAGVGGILTIAHLLDCNTKPSDIIWIDGFFNGGRINERYRAVESNDFVREWCDVLGKYRCLQKYRRHLEGLDQDVNEKLAVIADVLLQITEDFRKTRIKCIRDWVTRLEYVERKNTWRIRCKKHRSLRTEKVFLSTGSHPKTGPMQYLTPDGQVIGKEVIDLDLALDCEILQTLIKPDDCVVVVGSGQSAVLLLRYLSEMGCKSITNVYRLSLEQTLKGLRGNTLVWGSHHMNNVREIERIHEDDIHKVKCNKLIYATGFERNTLPSCNVKLDVDNSDGILAPSLYGFGIAFPDRNVLNDGLVMKRVGLTSFSRTLDRRMPMWLR